MGILVGIAQHNLRTRRNYTNLREGEAITASGSRVKGWRLGRKALVSIPCHIEPDMRFSLIRLSDNLLPGAFKV